jgi:CheY-like chemotaxis protein
MIIACPPPRIILRVLIVEDQLVHQKVLIKELQGLQGILQLEIDCVTNVEHATEQANQFHYDLIFLDNNLKDTDIKNLENPKTGSSTIQYIRDIRGNRPIIIMRTTDLPEKLHAIEDPDIGYNAYLGKNERIEETVRRYFPA